MHRQLEAILTRALWVLRYRHVFSWLDHPPLLASKERNRFCDVAAFLAHFVACNEIGVRASGRLFWARFAFGSGGKISPPVSNVARNAARFCEIPPPIRRSACKVEALSGVALFSLSTSRDTYTSTFLFETFSSCHFHPISLGRPHGPGVIQRWQFFNQCTPIFDLC
jgi:hypothetical protein